MLDGFTSTVRGDIFRENEPVRPIGDVSKLRPHTMAVCLDQQFIMREDQSCTWIKFFWPVNRRIAMR